MLLNKISKTAKSLVLTTVLLTTNAFAQQETTVKEYTATARVALQQKSNPYEHINPYTAFLNTYQPAKLMWANDGDSFFVSINKELYEIRLAGVDAREVCPNKPKKGSGEKCKPQEFAVAAKQKLLEICSKDMSVKFIDYDPRFNRVTSDVSCQGQDVSSVMVYNGLFHLYEPYTSMYRSDLYDVAEAGRRENLGIYSNLNLLHPSLCRKNIAYCY